MNNFAGMDTFYSKFSLPPTTDVIDERRKRRVNLALVPNTRTSAADFRRAVSPLLSPSPSLLV